MTLFDDLDYLTGSKRNPDPYMNMNVGGLLNGSILNNGVDEPYESDEDKARRLMANVAGMTPNTMNRFNQFLGQKNQPKVAPKEYYGLGAGMLANYGDNEMGSSTPRPRSQSAAVPLVGAASRSLGGFVGPQPDPFVGPRIEPSDVTLTPPSRQFVGPQPDPFVGPQPDPFVGPIPQATTAQPPSGAGSYGGMINPQMSSYDNGMPANPFYMGSRPDPVNILGVNGFRTGGSRAVSDDSEGRAYDMAGRQNLAMQEILGRNEATRANNQNDLMRTMLGVSQRGDAARANSENRFLGILGKVPEGKATPYIKEGMAAGHLDKTIGTDMLLNDMLTRAKQSAKTGSGIDLRKFLGTLSSEFNPNELSRAELINKIQQMGYTADQIDSLKDDPQVGSFAKSLLGPREYFETRGVQAIASDASERMKQLWSLISGR